MIAYEEARERLAGQLAAEDVERRILKLPKPAHAVADALIHIRPMERGGPEALLALSDAQRHKLFAALLPTLGSALEAMWQAGARRPYQYGWERRAFRAPYDPAASAARRFNDLRWAVGALAGYEIPDAAWVARWAPHLGHQAAIGLLLAAVIDAGGPEADAVLEILRASADGEEEIGGMGRHVIGALIACAREDAWEAVERLLLAAQREEGLRQVILETADEAHPEAFDRILRSILEHDLVRFSATARAVGVWLGLDEGPIRSRIERMVALRADPTATDDTPEDAYLALVATAWDDAEIALPGAAALLAHEDAEHRLAAAHLLAQLHLPGAAAPLAAALDDADLRVAARAFHGLALLEHAPEDTFERLERLLARLPRIAGPLAPAEIGRELLRRGADRPADLVRHLGAMDPAARAAVAGRLHGDAARPHLIALLGDPSPHVRETAVKAAAKLELREDEAIEVEALLARKAGDLRRGAVALLLNRPDAAVLASAERLLQDRRAAVREGGEELLRQLREAGRGEAAPEGEPPSLEDGLGLLDRSALTPPAQPIAKGIALVTPAALEALRSIDALVHEHRAHEFEIEVWSGQRETRALGELPHWPQSGGEPDGPPPPLPEVWTQWADGRDGLDLVRALLVPPPDVDGFAVVDRSVRRVLGGAELRHPAVAGRVLQWLIAREPPAGAADFALAAAEELLAAVPPERMDERDFSGARPLWHGGGWILGLVLARWLRHRCGFTAEQARRLWRLERWAQQPPATRRRGLLRRRTEAVESAIARPPLAELTAAFAAGAATEADVFDHLVSPPGERWRYGDLAWLSGRRPHPHAPLAAVVELIRRRILEVELARGEAPTAASEAANSLRHSGGLDTLVALLRALGKGKLVRGWSHDNAGRETVFSHLIRVTHPARGDTPAAFVERAAALPEPRIAELAAFAPQWAPHAEAALRRPGFATAIWWMHAHTKDDNWTVEAEVREAWTAAIAERTPLAAADLVDGAVDVAWFRAAYEELGEAGWELVDKAARYCSSSGGHKRAQLFAAAMRGAVTEAELAGRIRAKRQQDSVRALGLLPLEEGALLRRYEALQQFARESRQFGSMRQASEKRAAAIGLENLARGAGYADPTRLGWAMEVRGIADLADGPARVTAGDVEVALEIVDGLPEVSATRSGTALKSVPAAARKDPQVKALRARATELRRRRGRIRVSLEDAMVRGDELTAAELAELTRHPLLWPMLERLVLVDETGRLAWAADAAGERMRIAHPLDLVGADWPAWQRECLEHRVAQPFKQVFRELYLPTRDEREAREGSARYAGHQIQPGKALALLGGRGWVNHREDGLRRAFHDARVTASLWVENGYLTPAEVEPPAIELVVFTPLGEWTAMAPADVPPRVFSEVMRDLDLVVSVAHAGGVDPEASASTVEMRAALVAETCALLGIENVRVEGTKALIDGDLGEYSVHLGSATVHRRPGGAVCIVPVSGRQRGRLFLPFADEDPRTAEVLAKVLLLARDTQIKDPGILEQLRS